MRTWLLAMALSGAAVEITARADEPAPAGVEPASAAARSAAKTEWEALTAAVAALGKAVESGDPSGRMTAAHNEAAKHTTAAWRAIDAGDLALATTELRGGWGAVSPVLDDVLERSGTNTAIDLCAKTSAATSAWLAVLAKEAPSESVQADVDAAVELHAEATKLRASDQAAAFEKEREALGKAEDAYRLTSSPPRGT